MWLDMLHMVLRMKSFVILCGLHYSRMKHQFYFRLVQVCFTFSVFCSGTHEANRFLVVSGLSIAHKFYRRLRNTKPKFHNEPNIDISTKKQICADISSGHLFRKHPLSGMKLIKSASSHLIENYHYPTKSRQVRVDVPDGSTSRSKEIVFACLVQKLGCFNRKYYVSEEYNLSADSNGSRHDEHHVAGRFIFKKRRGHRKSLFLYGLAELPGTAYASPEHDIEHIYLQRRKNHHGMPWEMEEDALCGLSGVEKYRVCAAVFNSNYFEGKALPWNNRERIPTSCSMSQVSFQTEYGKKEAKKRLYKMERMLLCEHDVVQKKTLKYVLSHGYESNQIFVFFRDDETGSIFPENLMTDVRLPFIPRQSADPRISSGNVSVESSTEFMGVFSAHPPFPFPSFTFGIHE